MKVLFNYDKEDARHLQALAHILKKHKISPIGSDKTYTSESNIVETAKLHGCDCIVIANTESLKNVTGYKKATLDAFRGSLNRHSKIPILVVNSIAHIHTTNSGRFILEKDISKLARRHEVTPRFKYFVLRSLKDLPRAFDILSTAVVMSYDIETVTVNEDKENLLAGDTIITCASYSALLPCGRIVTFVLPLVSYLICHWKTEEDYAVALQWLRDVNALPIGKIMHNGLYDCTHSIAYRAFPMQFNYDTMAMAHSEFSELEKTLDFVASLHLVDYTQWKFEAAESSKKRDIEGYWRYNAKDSWYTLRIFLSQLKNAPEYAQRNYGHKFKYVYPSLYCAFEGMKVDNEALNAIREERSSKAERSLNFLRVCFDDPVFKPSWQQVEHYVYRIFGAAKPKKGKSKSGTDEKNLKAVGEQHPLLGLLTDAITIYRKSTKAVSNYCNYLQKNGRLLYSLNPFGTETGRSACNSSSFWCGTQVQNIPAYAKKSLVADEGFTGIEVDNKQSEGRCTAYLAQDEALIAALEDKEKDFYMTLGTLFFGIPYENVTEFFRNKVLKRIVHGTNYMMGGKTFNENIEQTVLIQAAAQLGMNITPTPSKNNDMTPVAFSSMLLEKYHVPFKRIRVWYRELFDKIAYDGKLVSVFGWTRIFFGNIKTTHKVFASAVAHEPQNLSVHILDLGFWRVYSDLVVSPTAPFQLGDFRLKAQIHDSIVAQIRDELVDIGKERMLECMTNPVEVYGRTMIIPLDAKTWKVWKA